MKDLHDKVNSILSTLDLDTPLNDLLLHSETLCVIRYEPREEYAKGGPTPDKEGGGEELQPEATAQGRHCRPPQAGIAGGDTTALPVEAPRQCRPTHLGTAGLRTSALPASTRRHCRPKPQQQPLAGTAAGSTLTLPAPPALTPSEPLICIIWLCLFRKGLSYPSFRSGL